MSEEDVKVSFGAALEGFNRGVKEVQEKVEGLTAPISELSAGFAEIGEAIAVAFAVEKIAEFARETAELGEKAERTAQMLGMTTEEVTRLQYATAVTGGSADQMTGILEKLSRSMAGAAAGGKAQQEAFKEAGVAYQDANGKLRPLNDMLRDLANSYAEHADGAEKTAMGIALMGRGAAEATPLLDKGAEGLDELAAKAQRAGVILSEDTAHAFAESAEKMNDLGQSTQGLGETIFSKFEPAIDSVVGTITDMVQGLNGAIQNDALLSAAMDTLVFAVDAVVAAVEALIMAFEVLWTTASGIVTALGQGVEAMASATVKAISGDFDGAAAAVNGGWKDIVGTYQDSTSQIATILSKYDENTKNLFGQGEKRPNVIRVGGKESYKAPGDTTGASDKSDAARTAVDGEIAVLREGLTRKRMILDEELKDHKISEDRWVTGTKAAVDAEYAAEVGLLQKEMTLGNLKVAQKANILNKIKDLEQKHATEVLKIEQKAAADALKSWQGPMDAIGSAFSSQVSSLLKGTETLGQAIQNIALDLATQVIEGAIKSITASAAQAFAGIFGFLAPSMGPAAAGPAVAGEAAVMGAASGLASLDVGTWGLPSDGPIMAHKGETIIPAFESGQFREAMAAMSGGGGGGQGGGDVHHHHWNAIDGASVAAFLKTHGDAVAKTVSGKFNAQRSLRPSY